MFISTSFSLPVLSLSTLILSATLTSSPTLVSALRTPSASNHLNHRSSNSRDIRRAHAHAHAHTHAAFDQIKRQPSAGLGPTAEETYESALKREVGRRGGNVDMEVQRFKKRNGKKVKVMRKRDGTTCKIQSSVPSSTATVATETDTDTWSASPTDAWTSSSSDSWTATSSSEAWTAASDSWTASSSSGDWSTSASPTQSVSVQQALTQNGGTSGLLYIDDPTCGNSNPTAEYPNGQPSWLSCGIEGGGWTPPFVSVAQVIGVSLASAADGVFSPCAAYIDWFTEIGEQYGIPGVALASIAMQESGCRADAVGPNGEIGLMQVTPTNCHNMAGINCWDYYGNIQAGAKVFSSYIDAAGGNMLLAMGQYNGWQSANNTWGGAGTTVWRTQQVCPCGAQQNLDYLNSFFNGWLQGKSVSTSYNNVANCMANYQC